MGEGGIEHARPFAVTFGSPSVRVEPGWELGMHANGARTTSVVEHDSAGPVDRDGSEANGFEDALPGVSCSRGGEA